MTKALRKAFEAASTLSEREQEALAATILEELAADKRWQGVPAQSQEMLKRLAEEALRERREGRKP
jgi:urease gamma subunit